MAAQLSVSDLLAYGEQQIGKPYVFGTAGPNTFDCSGLIQYMLKQFGVTAPHHAADQAKMGTPVQPNSIQAGDLVFSDWGDGPNSHVGIATDQGHVLVAPHTGSDVQIEPLSASYRQHITAVRRLPEFSTTPATAGGSPVGSATPASYTTGSGGGAPDPWYFSPIGPEYAFWKSWVDVIGKGQKAISDPNFVTGLANLIAEVGLIGQWILKLFIPGNFIRFMAGGAGLFMVLVGVFFLSRELKTS